MTRRMGRTRPDVARRRPLLVGPLVAAALCGLTGCGTAGAPAAVPSPVPAATGSPSPSPIPLRSLPALPSPSPSSAGPSFADGYAVACGGYPALSRVVALLRSRQVIGRGANLAATVGPLCAGGWQYTVLSEAGREPLQVVTRGTPSALVLVTAGTYVCTAMVRTQAPPGILTVAHC
jgi:hypothetical protein